jgi:hypothetical protein
MKNKTLRPTAQESFFFAFLLYSFGGTTVTKMTLGITTLCIITVHSILMFNFILRIGTQHMSLGIKPTDTHHNETQYTPLN